MEEKTVNILGTEYTIKIGNETEYPALEVNDGYMDSTTKEIVVCDMKNVERDPCAKKDLKVYQNKCLRHEIVHAFMEESGLSDNFEHRDIGIEETMVDWFAIQSPKIFNVFQELDIL